MDSTWNPTARCVELQSLAGQSGASLGYGFATKSLDDEEEEDEFDEADEYAAGF